MSHASAVSATAGRYDPLAIAMMGLVHVGAAVGIWLFPPSWGLVAVALASYYLRMFGITAGFHRYFSHRAFRTSRVFQFLLAWLGTTATQRGPLWWAAHHRDHHRHSDQEGDVHSPLYGKRGLGDGVWWSHLGWILHDSSTPTVHENIRDFDKFPELRWLDRNQLLPPLAYAALLLAVGGLPWLVWGFFVATAALWHGTFVINSLAHLWGTRRYATTDGSRNNLWLALLTLGEGWHNNHHHYQSSARQGFFWWEVDVAFYALKVLSWFGIVWKLRPVPERMLVATAVPPAPRPVVGLGDPGLGEPVPDAIG